jgi:hypothetical protein
MVLAWTIVDVRYRFRIRTAPIPLQGITFGVVTGVGCLTLLTDLWRTQQWYVFKGSYLSQGVWQAILGGLFFFTFVTWVWFAFIHRTVYGRWNAKRYFDALYWIILKGSAVELPAIADELSFSAESLIQNATDRGEFKHSLHVSNKRHHGKQKNAEIIADQILLLIADKRFCRAIVDSSPITPLILFSAIAEKKKFGVSIGIFGKNIVNQAINNKESFIFQEIEGYISGLIGIHKPLSQAIFSNYRLVEAAESLLDPDFESQKNWDASQWEAYCRLVLLTLGDYAKIGMPNHSYVLYRAISAIKHASYDIYMLNGSLNNDFESDIQARLRVIIKFIKSAIQIIDENGVPTHLKLQAKRGRPKSGTTILDDLAKMICELIINSAGVTNTPSLSWTVQHNMIWSELFNFDHLNGTAGTIIKAMVRRILYDEIVMMEQFPNYKGARVLAYCLNVMGLSVRNENHFRDSVALQKVILSWTIKNFAKLYSNNPHFAVDCLPDGITYEVSKHRLVKTYPANLLMNMPNFVFLNVNPIPSGVKRNTTKTPNKKGTPTTLGARRRWKSAKERLP